MLALLGTHVAYAFAEAAADQIPCWMPEVWCTVQSEDIAGFGVITWMFRDFIRGVVVNFAEYSIYLVAAIVMTGAAVVLLRSSLQRLGRWSRVLALLVIGIIAGTEFYVAEWGYDSHFRPEHLLEPLFTGVAAFAAAAMLTWWAIKSTPVGQSTEIRPIIGSGRPIVVAGFLLAVGVALTFQFLEAKRRKEFVGTRPPMLTLSFEDQKMDGWHGGHIWDHGPLVDVWPPLHVRGPALRVPPGARVTVTTSSPLGNPENVEAFIDRSSLPHKCSTADSEFLVEPLLCIDYANGEELKLWNRWVAATVDTSGSLSFFVPHEPGAYRVWLHAWWPGELGGGEQLFAIEIRKD